MKISNEDILEQLGNILIGMNLLQKQIDNQQKQIENINKRIK